MKAPVPVELRRHQEPDGPPRAQADEDRVEERRMVGREDCRSVPRHVFLAEGPEAKRQRERRPEDRAKREERQVVAQLTTRSA
jgi:hypothetical protein